MQACLVFWTSEIIHLRYRTRPSKVNWPIAKVADQLHVSGSPGGTPQRSPGWKPWETKPVITRKPRQGRHCGVTRTNVARHPRFKGGRLNGNDCNLPIGEQG